VSVQCQEETHALQQKASYSITSPARASKEGGTVRPSALAVYNKFEARWLRDRQIARLLALENPTGVNTRLPPDACSTMLSPPTRGWPWRNRSKRSSCRRG
jgi:hypothetical protein